MHPADRDCVERLQAGDRAALGELYDRYAALLHPLALRITGSAAEADEALFEAWVQVCRRAVPIGPRGSGATWPLADVARAAAGPRRKPQGPAAGRRAGG